MTRTLIKIFLMISLIFLPLQVHAEEIENLEGQITALQKGQEAPYTGILLDPVAAAKIHPHDRRRTIRALEYYEKTGQPISSGQTHFSQQPGCGPIRLLALDWPRKILHARINERVDAMFHSGWGEEGQGLLECHQNLSRTAAQAVGYREVLAFLRGEFDLEEAIKRTQAGTRQLARRQLIWLRSLADCEWVPMDTPMDAVATAEKIMKSRSDPAPAESESVDSS